MHLISSRSFSLAQRTGAVCLILASTAVPQSRDPTGTAASGAAGATIAVSNCDDSGTGSLRAAVADAASGDTIDMRGLGCRPINLTSGAIEIPQHELTMIGGGITVDAGNLSSVFRHQGTGWLRIRGMRIARGHNTSDVPPLGGCIYSAGSVGLSYVLVHWCVAGSSSNPGVGGGVYARRRVSLNQTEVTGNTSYAYESVVAEGRLSVYRSRIHNNHGGGAYGGRGLDLYGSTISGNNGSGYALFAAGGDITIGNSTISGNSTGRYLQLIDLISETNGGDRGDILIFNSTISGNRSTNYTMRLEGGTAAIVNSTIAFNDHTGENYGGRCTEFATVTLLKDGLGEETPRDLESTIISNNTCNGNPYADIGPYPSTAATIAGAHNLVTLSNLPLPQDTISADPLLVALADNGGRTKTHALPQGSPAIDVGSNTAGLNYDQRGPGFPRVNGSQADIGAYER